MHQRKKTLIKPRKMPTNYNSSLMEKISDLKKTIAKLERDLAKCNKQSATTVKALRDIVTEKDDEISRLTNLVTAYDKKYISICDSKNETITRLQQESDRLLKTISDRESEIKNLHIKINNLENDLRIARMDSPDSIDEFSKMIKLTMGKNAGLFEYFEAKHSVTVKLLEDVHKKTCKKPRSLFEIIFNK